MKIGSDIFEKSTRKKNTVIKKINLRITLIIKITVRSSVEDGGP